VLEGIQLIGNAVLGKASLVESLVDTRLLEESLAPGREEPRYIVVLDVRLDPLTLRADLMTVSEKTLAEVLWVGNASGSNSPQDRLTTNRAEYLASQTIPNLRRSLPQGGNLRGMLDRLFESLYVDLGKKDAVFPNGGGGQQYDRYRYVWDLSAVGISDPKLAPSKELEEVEDLCRRYGVDFLTKEFLVAYARRKGKAQDVARLVGRVLQSWAAEELDIKDSQASLYTVRLDGNLLARHKEYVSYLERSLVEEAFEGANRGVCHVCGAATRVTANTTRFKLLKFYITDKPGFASGLRKRGFFSNYAICERCYRSLLAGERFVDNSLLTRLGRTRVYVIPTFHAPDIDLTGDTLEQWAGYLKKRLSAAATMDSWREFQEDLERYQEFEDKKALFVLDMLFATKGKAAVKIDKLVASVPPSRLDRLDEVRNEVRDWADCVLGKDEKWDLSLEKLFYLLPLTVRDGQVQAKPYLELLDSLLSERPLNVNGLIFQLLETACVYRYEANDQYVQRRPKTRSEDARAKEKFKDNDLPLVIHMLESQLFIRYLKLLGLLDVSRGGGEKVEENDSEIEHQALDEELRKYMDALGLDGPRRALFLLGVLIGRIGSTPEQRSSGKPILNKVHFQGMDSGKVLRLANEVYEKLRQYKIAEWNEKLYAAMKARLDGNLRSLKSPQENTFWLLSGYSFQTWQAIRSGGRNRE